WYPKQQHQGCHKNPGRLVPVSRARRSRDLVWRCQCCLWCVHNSPYVLPPPNWVLRTAIGPARCCARQLSPPVWRGSLALRSSRVQHLGQYGFWLVVPVSEPDTLAHVLPTGLGVHYFRENLQAVAVWVEEVDAVGHTMVGRVVD